MARSDSGFGDFDRRSILLLSFASVCVPGSFEGLDGFK